MEAAISAHFPLPVLLFDDGELLDVREVLQELGVAYIDAHHEACASSGLESGGLVISTPSRSPQAADYCAATPRRVFLEILQHDSPAPDAVSEARCDYIVRRPVHIAALKLLIQRALYTGPERRRRERVAIGAAVTLRSGLRSWVSTLLDLSLRSCRLLSSRPVSRDRHVTVRLPRRLTGGETLSLRGRVVRVAASARGDRGMYEIAVSFDSLEPAARRALRVILEGYLVGPASLVTESVANSRTGRGVERVGGARLIDRRSELRQTDSGLPPAARINPGTPAAVLIGRDLSPTGMRVERDDDLELGDKLDLLLHGGLTEAPIAVKAVAERIDESGCFLRFVDVAAEAAARIAELVEALVVSERSRVGSPGSDRVVISEVVGASSAA